MILKTKLNSSSIKSLQWKVSSNQKIEYSIVITKNLFDKKNNLLAMSKKKNKKKKRRLIFIDSNVNNLYQKKIEKYFLSKKISHQIIPLDIKEEDKNLYNLEKILNYIDNFGLERRSEPIIAIGGGVLTDIVGFAASIYRRGVPYIKVATTLLCIVDACVGVKTSINHFSRRNRLGTYFAPETSYVDLSLLKTVPKDEISASLGEIIKIAVIKNKKLFTNIFDSSHNLLKAKFYNTKLGEAIVAQSIESMIEELHKNLDETNLKRSVDFGHTFSPVIEMRSLEDNNVRSLKHGEAVCLDVLLSSCISHNRGYLEITELKKIFTISKLIKMPLVHTFILNPDYLIESLLDATKHRDGSQNFPIPISIGSHKFLNDIKEVDIKKAIKLYVSFLND
mgnify:CR=1 FL=1|jgi:3-dehydroquinate synthetase